MRYLLLIILLFCVNSSVSFSQNLICKYTGFNCTEIKYKNLIKKNDLYFEKFKDYPFTGSSIGQKQGSIVNGRKNGLWKIYFKSGEKKSTGVFKDNIKQGEWLTYHRNGLIKTKGIYKDNKRNGDWVELDKYGGKSFRYLFKKDNDLKGNGKYIDGYKIDRNGNKIIPEEPIDFEKYLKFNQNKLVVYKDTNKLFSGIYLLKPTVTWFTLYHLHSVKDGKNHGLGVTYEKPLKIKSVINYVNGKSGINGVYASYWNNGNLESKVIYKDAKYEGLSLYVYKNGNIQEQFVYKNGKIEGEYRRFHENGKLMIKSFYNNGVLEGLEEEFDKYGNLISSTMHNNRKK